MRRRRTFGRRSIISLGGKVTSVAGSDGHGTNKLEMITIVDKSSETEHMLCYSKGKGIFEC